MNNIARSSIERPIYTWLLIIFCFFGGTWSFLSLGQLEDPAFTIKTAAVVTQYPGASAEQVASEITEPLESAIQKMAEIDKIISVNTPGQSLIEVEIQPTIKGSDLPDVWTRLRAQISDAAARLPQGAGEPFVNDSFGDVFGLYYAVTAEGFDDAEKHSVATFLRRELLTVPGVADVSVAGLPEEAIYVEPDLALSTNQNVSPQAVISAIANANKVVEAGDKNGVRLQAPEGSDSVQEIAGLSVGIGGNVITLADVTHVTRSRVEKPSTLIRFGGTEAFTLGVAGQQSENIVAVGKRVDQKLAELDHDLPYGIKLHPVYQQHLVVEKASNSFLINLAMSVCIVVIVLAVFMGWRAAVVVGSTLLLTVLGTLLFMKLFSIEMERISLGALIIAMGMLVDNAIVVAEGMSTAMKRGLSARRAATEAAVKTQIPLLGATVIGIMAFAAIGLSPDATGEFLFSLFAVIGISLLLSWILALTVTPLLGSYLFVVESQSDEDAYQGFFFRSYVALLQRMLQIRWLVVAALLVMTVGSFIGFGHVKQQFFPASNTPLFFAHYKLAQGADIHRTSSDLNILERWLSEREEVVSVTSFVGGGASRFMLTYPVERPNPSYGQLIIRTETTDQIGALQEELEQFARGALPDGEFRTKLLLFGPGGGDPIQLRLSGSNPQVLRELGHSVMSAMTEASTNIVGIRTDWREQELVVAPDYATDRAQTAGITREDVAQTLRFATNGLAAGVYREGERQVPIIVRAPESDLALIDQSVYSESLQTQVPLGQVIDGFTYEVQNTLVHRRNRVPTLTVSADISRDANAAAVHAEIRESIEQLTLPPGYRMQWGGEYESSRDAQQSLGQQLPVAFIIMIVISILLFNALKQPLIVWMLVPMSLIGVVSGLLLTGLPFSFTALLGLLSLSGMLLKNGIVLVEEIDLVRAAGTPLKQAIFRASTSRLRPVMLAAATTILGMIPLLGDAFFVSMAVTIMAGLAFASVLTLIAAPVLYYILFKRDEESVVPAMDRQQPAMV